MRMARPCWAMQFLTLYFTMDKKVFSYGDDIANYGDINLSID